MVKGITRQVIVVKGPDRRLFDQAIFLVREDVLAEGGVSEEALLEEARMACKSAASAPWKERLQWSAIGAGITALAWVMCAIL